MNNLKIFENKEFGEIRTAVVDDEPMFCLIDICKALEMSNPTIVAQRLDDDERTKLDLGRQGETNFITESGLYTVILRSDKPNAKKFRKWVTSEVLPSIRKNGGYIAGQETMSDDELMARALQVAQNKIMERDRQIETMKPKAIFADAVATSHTSILIGDLAKLINQNGVNIGQKRLFKWLRDNGYLIRRNGSDWNMPTQRSMEMKLFEVKESTINNPDGSIRINRTPKVTGKGQQYFVNKFLAE
jgi:anti-repressor protein